MIKKPINIKGSSFTLSVININNAPLEEIIKAIQEKVKQAPNLFQHAPVIINVANLNSECNWLDFSRAILATGLHVVAVSGCQDSTLRNKILSSGLPIINEGKVIKNYSSAKVLTNKNLAISPSILINTPVRSGQKIYARNSYLIITSSVSAGAELIADGNIHIYGMMRGRALAGASGDIDCQIFCSYISPELVSIAGQYWLLDQIPVELLGKAVRIYLRYGALYITPLIH
ncbi:septum site-determining protein MinC [Candidatus Palibaumannia cicadellinicola]|uniref:Probable septum site-determining protein MinC n=1 Tax=Candidatus Palibaumannia cicadellinicola TaxID=186490 RepID=A0A0K2BKX9_9GAMM|nr:septum site-determining protein MinC [Candidatus Baumannia cicadellinicola]AKZ65985.1 Septum site-determining protein [Candidatus Baumannia cicadellinicola]